jgi:hypothetical protein
VHDTTKALCFIHQAFEYEVEILPSKPGACLAEVTVSREGIRVTSDKIDLAISVQRGRLAKAVHRFDPDCQEDAVERDLEAIRFDLKTRLLDMHTSSKDDPKLDQVSLTEEQRAAAETLAKDPRLVDHLVKMMGRCGIVGELFTAIIIYVACTTRLLKTPMCLVFKGESSSGKSFVVITVLSRLMPAEAYKSITAATSKSLYHLDEHALEHKILFIAEKPGADQTDYPLRIIQSDQELTLLITIKDEATGKYYAEEKKVRGPVVTLVTTTEPELHKENETRLLTITSDDSERQNRAVIKHLALQDEGKFQLATDEEIETFKNLQRILYPHDVIIPYASKIAARFPANKPRTRRDYSKLSAAIKAFTLLHQYQRETQRTDTGEALVATADDYAMASYFLGDALESTIVEIPDLSQKILKYCLEHRFEDAGEHSTISDDARGESSVNLFDDDSDVAATQGSDVSSVLHTFEYDEVRKAFNKAENTIKKWTRNLFEEGCLKHLEDPKGGRGKKAKFICTGFVPPRCSIPSVIDVCGVEPNWKPNSEWSDGDL